MIFAVDVEAARQALGSRLLRCPKTGCDGRLHRWGAAAARRVMAEPGRSVVLRPDRARCGQCRASHVVLPAWYLPRRGVGVEVVGSALLGRAVSGQGHRRLARALGLAEATVRGWLRGAIRGAEVLTAQAVGVAGVAAPVWSAPAVRRPAAGPLTAAVEALARAAAEFARPIPPSTPPASVTGIDYLGLLVTEHRQALHDRLHLVDPGGQLPTLPPWQVINLITRGRLLTSAAPAA